MMRLQEIICVFLPLCVLTQADSIFRPAYELLLMKVDNYILPVLPFEFNELEPYIDANTIDAHLFGHHEAYKHKTNLALGDWREEEPDNEFARDSILNIIGNLDKIPEKYRKRIRNIGGGFVNHCFYWSVMSGNDEQEERRPKGKLLDEINEAFGSFENFQKQWNDTALSLFGSGYVWLNRRPGGDAPNLSISTTANQDSPISDGLNPILVQDLWEHAWYLQHKHNKAAHIKDWWMVVDWDYVEKLDQWWTMHNSGDLEKLEEEKRKLWEQKKADFMKEMEEKMKEDEEKKKEEEEEANKTEL